MMGKWDNLRMSLKREQSKLFRNIKYNEIKVSPGKNGISLQLEFTSSIMWTKSLKQRENITPSQRNLQIDFD